MKKQLVSILTAGCLMAAMVPAAFAADASDLQARIDAAAPGAVVNLEGDETISTPIIINKPITLDGNQNTLTMTGGDFAIKVQTDGEVIVKELTINATETGGRGVRLSTTKPNFTLSDCTLTVDNRGIGFSDDGSVAGASVLVEDSTTENSQKPDDKTYDNWTCHTDTRGIAMWNNTGTQVTIDNSTIQGFAYTINLAGDMNSDGIRDFTGTTISVENGSILKGWTAFNVWSANTTFNISDSTLKGINVSNGPSDGFSTIVVNDDIYGYGWGRADKNVFNIYGGTITNYRGGSASEELFRVDDKGITEVNFFLYEEEVPVSIIDGSGDSVAVFNSGYSMLPDDWIEYMSLKVHGTDYCIAENSEGGELPFIPNQF